MKNMNNTNDNTAPALSTLAPQIAAALSGYLSASVGYAARWTAKPISEESTWSNFYLTREDGLTLFLAGSQGGWAAKGRFLLQHSRPRNNGKYVELWENHAQMNSPEITVAETKSAEKIAADIIARLLPEAERIDALARESIARDNAAETAQNNTARAVAAAIGAEVEKGHDGKPRASFYHRGASVAVHGGDSVKIELHSVNKAQALALLAFMESPAYRGTEN